MQKQMATVAGERKLQRLALIKERHRKIVLQSRYELDNQIRDVFDDEFDFDFDFEFDFD